MCHNVVDRPGLLCPIILHGKNANKNIFPQFFISLIYYFHHFEGSLN
jgi:hypothetical protein